MNDTSRNRSARIYPVIHLLDRETAFAQVAIARLCEVSGVFLISHHGDDDALVKVAREAKRAKQDLLVGINLLSRSPQEAAERALEAGLDMVWADDMGVDSRGLTEGGLWLKNFASDNPGIKLFASVAFKYRAHEPDPVAAVRNAVAAGFIPTTSGAATGSAPDVAKIVSMSSAAAGELAIASGMTPENVSEYAPYLGHILVATGVSIDDYRIDVDRLRHLIGTVGAWEAAL